MNIKDKKKKKGLNPIISILIKYEYARYLKLKKGKIYHVLKNCTQKYDLWNAINIKRWENVDM